MAAQGVLHRKASETLSAVNRLVRMRRSLTWKSVENAVVFPLFEHQDVSRGAGVMASLGDGEKYVRSSGLRRFMRATVPPPRPRDSSGCDSVPIGLFGGYLFNHFGHFLLESLCRLWIEDTEGIDHSIPLIWIKWDDFDLPEWMLGLIRRIALDREIILLDSDSGPIAVDRMIVPQQGFELREWMHPAQMRRLGTTSWRPDSSNPRIWLSRSGLETSSSFGIIQQQEIEAHLEDLGWLIVQPESMSIDDQIALLASASHVAGVEGSALHGLVLVGGFGGTIDILQRDASPNYDVVAIAGNWDQRILKPEGRVSETTVFSGMNSGDGRFASRVIVEDVDPFATALKIHQSSCRRRIG